jgi:hypothetical protein
MKRDTPKLMLLPGRTGVDGTDGSMGTARENVERQRTEGKARGGLAWLTS